jgi:hypothetical protein
LGHFFFFDLHHAARIHAADVAARDAGIHLLYLAIGHQLRLLQRACNRADSGFDVHHHAFFHARGLVHAHADDFEHPVRFHFPDDGDDLGRTDVQADH